MTPMIPNFTRSQAEQVMRFRERGWTRREVAEAMGRCTSAIARYERIYEKHGAEAFARG